MNNKESKVIKLISQEKGNFTQVPNEVIEFFMNRKTFEGNSREYAIIFFLIRELQGWDYKFKPIETYSFVQGTGLAEQHVSTTLKNLTQKRKVILKKKIPGFRTPLYGFNEELIGRVVVNPEPRNYFELNSKVIDLVSFKIIKSDSLRLSEVVAEKRQKQLIQASKLASKDTEIHLNTLSEGKINKNDWEQVKAYLLTQFPNDAKRLEGTYKQIKQNGYEKEGCSPRHISNLPAWLYSSYKDIRNEYAHHDGRKLG